MYIYISMPVKGMPLTGKLLAVTLPPCCRADSAHIRQSGPERCPRSPLHDRNGP